jgi:ribosomal protein L16 Arg81 hydroxylase
MANFEIQAFNAKLSKIANSFRDVALVEMDFNREHFTKHGLHLNNAGKEGLAKLIASEIDKFINNINKIEPVTAPNWKEEATNVSVNKIEPVTALNWKGEATNVSVNKIETVTAPNWKEEATNLSVNKIEPVTALNWKGKATNVSVNVTDNHKPNMMSTEDDFSKVLVFPIQIHNSQGNMTDSESLRRTSNRQKKAPVTKNKNFLW